MQYTSKEVYEYVSKQSNDKIVEWKKCRISGQEFPIYQSDLEFYDKVSPKFKVDENFVNEFFDKNNDVSDNFEYINGELKVKIPTPTLCPEERERRRFSFVNDKNLYVRKCDHSGKSIISVVSPDKPYKVFNYDFWQSRNWDIEKIETLNDRSFESNFSDLLLRTPVLGRSAMYVENSDYSNGVINTKNCYMCFYGLGLEDCMYVYNGMSNNTNCIDCDYINGCSFCFDCVEVSDSSSLFHSQKCSNCHNSYYLRGCDGCHDCFNCTNLFNKSYCVNNEQYTNEEYDKIIDKVRVKDLPGLLSVVGCDQVRSENSAGDNYIGCKNCFFSSGLTNCENTKYTRDILNQTDVYDGRGVDSSLGIEAFGSGYSYRCCYIFTVLHSNDALYSFYCENCDHIFGCVGLNHKSYCIYNKEYTESEYNRLVPNIIAQMIRDKQWGEFFDPQLSYFGYNETMFMDYFPLTKEEVLDMGYKWSDYEAPTPKVEKIVEGAKLPKQGCRIIKDKKPEILEKILNYAVVCEISKKPFRITKQEIEFYVKHNIPLPTKHPNIRHQERLLRKAPTIMHLVSCDECGNEMLSVHLPGENIRVLCEKCYNSKR